MKQLGTILPNATTFRSADAFAKQEAAMKESVAKRELAGYTRRVVGGEVRYYDTAKKYAVVSRKGQVLWFVVRVDGDYRI